MNTGQLPFDSALGRNHGTHMQLMLGVETPELKSVVYHELAHFFTPLEPRWLSEGTAEFLAHYTLQRREGISLQKLLDRAQRVIEDQCHPEEVTNIHELVERMERAKTGPIPVDWLTIFPCNYAMGASFLLKMHELLGDNAISAALSEVYPSANDSLAPPVYLTFEALYSRTPPEKREEFLALYQTLHGSPDLDRWLR